MEEQKLPYVFYLNKSRIIMNHKIKSKIYLPAQAPSQYVYLVSTFPVLYFFFPQRELLKFYLLQALMKLKYSYELRKDNMIYLDKSL